MALRGGKAGSTETRLEDRVDAHVLCRRDYVDAESLEAERSEALVRTHCVLPSKLVAVATKG